MLTQKWKLKRSLFTSFTKFFKNHIFHYPTPTNITYQWSFGSQLGIFLVLQVLSGVFLAMHYVPNINDAFASVDRIMVDVKYGYILRYGHSNGATFLFILMYNHIGRSLFHRNYLQRPATWVTGVILMLLMMAIAFIGYVLPWGQMSFWGATVITNLLSSIPYFGDSITVWIWGGFSVGAPTLTRFFSLHYVLSFVLLGVVFLHLAALHNSGSSESASLSKAPDKVPFWPYFSFKDAYALLVMLTFFVYFIFFKPNYFGHSDNFIPANPLTTPAHIVPEWYFTPFYAILRACPDKVGGTVSMLFAIVVLFLLPLYRRISSVGVCIHDTRLNRFLFWSFVADFFGLMYLGHQAATDLIVFYSQALTVYYFMYFLVILPLTIWLDSAVHARKLNKNSKNIEDIS